MIVCLRLWYLVDMFVPVPTGAMHWHKKFLFSAELLNARSEYVLLNNVKGAQSKVQVDKCFSLVIQPVLWANLS